MEDVEGASPAVPLPEIGRLTVAEIHASLAQGWDDFRRAPLFGLFFSSVYVLGGLVILATGGGIVVSTLIVSLGFPLVAPFAAVGLYEVSRRLEAGTPLVWSQVLGVVWAERNRQIPWAGAIIVIAFLFWTFLAHMLFALMLGLAPATTPVLSLDLLMTTTGATLTLIQAAVGGGFAFLMFGLTAVSLPLLLDREVDFVSAMILSFRAVLANLPVMLVWAAIIAGCLIAGMIPAFLGLFVALPVLGHATWHIYRRVLYDPAP
jgi:uncharacterized membrane protein